MWRHEELPDEWLLPRILGLETEDERARKRMDAGTALHAAFEHIDEAAESMATLVWGGYRFDFNCSVDLVAPDPDQREVELTRSYGDILVTGHADGICADADLVIDYKTTQKFDWDRYMESAQWKFYLDMSGCGAMLYQIFVMRPFGDDDSYSISEFHKLKQYAYPEMHADCLQLVKDYRETVIKYLEKMLN